MRIWKTLKDGKKFTKCVECGKTVHPYLADGLCTVCYNKRRNAKRKQYRHDWFQTKKKRIKEAKCASTTGIGILN